MIEDDIDEEDLPIPLEICENCFELFISFFVCALEDIMGKLELMMDTVIGVRTASLLDRGKMKCIISKLNLSAEIGVPFLDASNTPWKDSLLPQLS